MNLQTSNIKEKVITVIATVLGCLHLYTAVAGILPLYQHRSIHLCVMLVLGFLMWSPKKENAISKVAKVWNALMIAASVVVGVYMAVFYYDIQFRQGHPSTADVVMCVLLMIVVLDATRKKAGYPIFVITVIFCLYVLFGHYLNGTLRHAKLSTSIIVAQFFNTTGGVLASPIGITSTYIIIFIIFGAFLEVSGAGEFFNKIARTITKNSIGGPAKASVVASALMGTISGSTVANVAGTGAFTIPLMKKCGYDPEFAGAVEAAASMGGQILPPIMGSSIFIMAELTGVPYGQICIYALIPALLYFFAIYMSVHFEAVRRGLKPAVDEMVVNESIGKLLIEGIHYILAILVLIGSLVMGWTAQRAGMLSIAALVVLSWLRKETRITLPQIQKAIEKGTKGTIVMAIACAASGIIMGSISITSLGTKLSTFVHAISGGHMEIALVMTIVASIILGMGVVSVSAYIILAVLLAPVLESYGMPLLVAHLFIYFYGMASNITPPVALGSLTAAGISGGNFFKTSVKSMRLAFVAFLIPLIFAYDQKIMLMEGLGASVIPVVTAVAGVLAISSAFAGYFKVKLTILERCLFAVGGVMLFLPSAMISMIGLALALVGLWLHLMRARKLKTE